MKDFWLSCGHHLLDRDEGGGLLITDDFLKVYLARPELTPPQDACPVERTLHAALLANPRRPVSDADIAAIADADARENWTLMIAFRNRLVAHRTLEAAYVDLVRNGAGSTPPLFINQLVHVILRNILDRCEDTLMLRAAEIFFRPQRLTVHENALIAADEEVISGSGGTPASPLVSMLGLPAEAAIDVLGAENEDIYWDRSDLFDTAIDMTAGKDGLAAFARVIERWIEHLLNIEVQVEPLVEIRDENLSWYVGLDAEATRLGDRLWNGKTLTDTERQHVIGLFRLSFRDSAAATTGTEPVFLILAMNGDKILRMKPQNLIVGLPVRQGEAVS
jgi:hypothetical protein